MKKLLLLICIFQGITAFGQDTLFSKVYYEDGIENSVKTVVNGFDNDIYIAGQRSWGEGFVMRLDSLGNFLWSKNITVTQQVKINHIAKTADSNIVVVGDIMVASENKAYCVKMNQQGDTLWSRSFAFGAVNYCTVSRVLANPDSTIVLTGKIDTDGTLFIAKLSVDGDLIWSNVFSEGTLQNVTALDRFADGSYLIGGYTNQGAIYTGFFQHLTSNGQLDWSQQLQNTVIQDIKITSGGIVSLYYDFQTYMTGLLKMNLGGTPIWQKNYSEISSNTLVLDDQHLTLLSDTCIAIAIGDQMSGTAVVKFDSNGVLLHHRKLMLGSNNVLEAQNKGLFVIGIGPMYGVKSILNYTHIGLIKTDSLLNIYTSVQNGSCDYGSINPQTYTASVTTAPINLVSNGTLGELTPLTVVNPQTLISYVGCVDFLGGIDENAFAQELRVFPNSSSGIFNFVQEDVRALDIRIYNSNGQQLLSTSTKTLSTQIDLSGFSEGIYFYTVERSDHQQANGKILLMH